MANWFVKIKDSKDNNYLLSVLFEILLEEYEQQRVSQEEYVEYRDLICYYKDCITLDEEKSRLSNLYNLSL